MAFHICSMSLVISVITDGRPLLYVHIRTHPNSKPCLATCCRLSRCERGIFGECLWSYEIFFAQVAFQIFFFMSLWHQHVPVSLWLSGVCCFWFGCTHWKPHGCGNKSPKFTADWELILALLSWQQAGWPSNKHIEGN